MTSERRVTFVKGVIPLHYSDRTVEEFSIGDDAWISYDGTKAYPVTVVEVDDRYCSVKVVAPKSEKGARRCFRLDEVRSTPELACINHMTL